MAKSYNPYEGCYDDTKNLFNVPKCVPHYDQNFGKQQLVVNMYRKKQLQHFTAVICPFYNTIIY